MNITISNGSIVKGGMYTGDIDFEGDNFGMRLMRGGFSFNSASHLYLKNIGTNTGSINYTVTASTKKITRSTGTSFITSGFVAGNIITATGTNKGPYKITSVTADEIRFSLVDAATVADETAVGQTITSSDVVPNINLTIANVTATAATSTITRAAGTWFGSSGIINGYSFITNDATNPGPWTVVSVDGADMVVEPAQLGGTALADDLTPSTYDFDNNYSNPADSTTMFTVSGNNLYLNSFDFITVFGDARHASPGAIIFDQDSTGGLGDIIICYIKFSPWTLSF